MRAMTAKAARNSRSKTSVSLILAAVARQATGTPSRSVAIWYLVPRLALSVGLGPVRSPPRLARTEQVSRIRYRGSGPDGRAAWRRAARVPSRAVLFRPSAPERGAGSIHWPDPGGLIQGGPQTAPGRAFAQKAPQSRHNPNSFARRVDRATVWLLIAGVDNRGDEMKKPDVQ